MTEVKTEDLNDDAYGSVNSFFNIPDKKINRIDDVLILSKIIERYPELNLNDNEQIIKNVMIAVFDDQKLINKILKDYGLNFSDLLTIIYKQYSFIFNNCLIKKLREVSKRKSYAKKIRNY